MLRPSPELSASLSPPDQSAEAGRTKVPPRASGAGGACSAPLWPNLGGQCFRFQHRCSTAKIKPALAHMAGMPSYRWATEGIDMYEVQVPWNPIYRASV